MEENGDVEENGVDDEGAEEVGEYEVGAWGAGEEVKGHDWARCVEFGIDQKRGAKYEYDEGREDKRMGPRVYVSTETLQRSAK